MARDMDFSGSRNRGHQPRIAKVQPAQAVSSASLVIPAPTNNSVLMIWSITVIMVAVAIFAFWRFFQPTSISQKAAPAVTQTNQSGLEITNSNSLVATKNSLPSVQVYDSGAGPDAVNATIDNLKALGYPTENLAKSQFNYNKTYIWYVTGLQAEAAKIQSALTAAGRTVEPKESKSAGSFEIMILLGTK